MLIICESDPEALEKADATHNTNRKVLGFGKLNDSLPFQIANRQCDLMTVCCEGSDGVLIFRGTPRSVSRPSRSAYNL